MKYPTRKFLSALSLGRGARYFVVAWLGKTYGKQIFGFFSKYYKPILISLIALAAVGVAVGLVFFLRRQKKKPRKPATKAA